MAETAQVLYARSLLEAAQEADCLKAVRNDMGMTAQLFAENPDYLRLLSSPAVSGREKQDSLDAVFGGRVAPYLVNFLKVLVQNNRISAFLQIRTVFEQMADRAEGIFDVEVTTAVPLTPRLREKLCQKLEQLTGKRVRLTERVDPAVLGGVLLCYDNKEIDGTIRQRLAALKKQLDSVAV